MRIRAVYRLGVIRRLAARRALAPALGFASLASLACGADAGAPRAWRPTWAGVVAGASGELGTFELTVANADVEAPSATGTAAFTFAARRFVLFDDGSDVDTLRVAGASGTIYGRLRCAATRGQGGQSDDAARGTCTLDDGAERPLALVAHDGEARRACGNFFWPDQDGVLSLVASARAVGAVAFGASVRWSATATRTGDVGARLDGPIAVDGGGLALRAALGDGGASGTFSSTRASGRVATNAETCPQRP